MQNSDKKERFFISEKVSKFLKNSYYEGLLQDLFCEKDGFFSIFLHFFYQKNQISKFYPNFLEDFAGLLNLEEKACAKVSELIIELGGDAKFYSANRKFFSTSGLDYVKNLASILEMDIELVEKSVIDIRSAYAKIENANIRASLNEILIWKNEELKILKDCFLMLEDKDATTN